MIAIPEEMLLDPKNKLEIIIKDTELKVDNVYAIAIWNAAIEAALVANAKIGGTTEADVAIRRLLK